MFVYNKWYNVKLTFKKETTNPDEMEIKDELVFNGITWSEADEIEYNNIGAFQTSNSNTPGYYIVKWIGHSFNPPVIIPGGELFCPEKFMTPMIKTSYWYHDPDEAIPFMVKLKKLLCLILN